ncbi:hypothetical protein ABFO19_12960 [Xanthomonas citri pv. glycines]|uniref:Secreted protein n=1 Tax=Xanthomonas campestris pv. glycines TaxID=473421 RepID=A0AAX0I284_XANCG|nr:MULTISPECIES: hypothetical protein [Xanthomonas]ARV23515.1 hypothetical protein A9D66_13110 [Xanthomonas citri pv. glycines str. 12-2]OEY90974.1 hypothetical protein BIY41_13130 [Xanthomonas citri pv. glycines]OOX00911.1 hypothetical protein Xgly_18680 [Xanthomonas citri pv. glycines]QTK36969.1 hypothetical protein XcgCFBP2526_12845 [Xanthomonas citri pv. glycines CFBP 2526]QTK41473.1 hypothetical protein XcgCFBP7119R_13585 [Xanthomonas citri pv. glycines]
MLAGLSGMLTACPVLAQTATACDAQSVAAVAAGAASGAAGAVPVEHAVAQTCKPWPYDPSIRLAAIAFAGDATTEAGERNLELRVAMLDARTAQVVALYSQDMGEDAGFELAADSLRLDTARYDLAPGVRAVGVVVHSVARGPSCPDFDSNDALTLLVREQRRLRPVLQRDLTVWRRVQGEPCNWGATGVVTERGTLTLSMDAPVHAGHAGIALTANLVTSTTVEDAEDIERTHRQRQLLRYDGTRYVPVSRSDDSWPFGN